MAYVPTLSRVVDTAFTSTWYEIQAKATDNILDSNVVLAALRDKGCMKNQVGGEFITRTVRYGTKTAIAIIKGDVLPTGEDELDTMARWDWKYLSVHVQRSLQDDQKNQGPAKIASLVARKLEAARDALETKFEAALLAAIDTDDGTELRAARDPYSLFNIVPGASYNGSSNTTRGSYTYGNIDCNYTDNPWWQPKYTTSVAPALLNIYDQLKTTRNNVTRGGRDFPDLVFMDQTRYEAFESAAEARIQKTQPVGGKMADLGYDGMRFKGADIYWSPSWLGTDGSSAGQVAILNSRWIDVVYDPTVWFEMIPWDYLPNQLERITRIVCALAGPICYQPRRQALITAYSS